MAGFWTGFAQAGAPAFTEAYNKSYSEMKAYFDDRAQQKAAQAEFAEFEKQRLPGKAGVDILGKELQDLAGRVQMAEDPAERSLLLRELDATWRNHAMAQQAYFSNTSELGFAMLGKTAGNPHAERLFGSVLAATMQQQGQWSQRLADTEQQGREFTAQLAAIKAQGGEARATQAAGIEGEKDVTRMKLTAASEERALGEEHEMALEEKRSKLRISEDEARASLLKSDPESQIKTMSSALGLMSALADMGVSDDAQQAIYDKVPAFSENGINIGMLRDKLQGFSEETRTAVKDLDTKIQTLEKSGDKDSLRLAGKLKKRAEKLRKREQQFLEENIDWQDRLEGAGDLEAIGLRIGRWFGSEDGLSDLPRLKGLTMQQSQLMERAGGAE